MNKIIKEETSFNKEKIIEEVCSIIGGTVDKHKVNTLLNVLFFDKIKLGIFTKQNPFNSTWSKKYRMEADIVVAKKIFEKCGLEYPLEYDVAFIVDNEDIEVYQASDITFELNKEIDLYIRTTIPNITEMMNIFEEKMNIHYTSETSFKLWDYFERINAELCNSQYLYQYGGNCNDFIQNPIKDFVALYKGGYGDCGIVYISKEYQEIQMY